MPDLPELSDAAAACGPTAWAAPLRVLAVSNDKQLLDQTLRLLSALECAAEGLNEPQRLAMVIRWTRPDVLLADLRPGSGLGAESLRPFTQAGPLRESLRILAIADLQSPGSLATIAATADDVLEAGAWGELLARLRVAAAVTQQHRDLAAEFGVDPRTGLPTADHFERQVSELWRRGGAVAALHASVDYFPQLLDSEGRESAERAWEAAIEAVRQLAPTAVTAPAPGRVVAVFESPREAREALDVAEAREALDVAEALRTGFESASRAAGAAWSLSIGVSEGAGRDDWESLLKGAAEAAGVAARRGGNLALHDEERASLDAQWRGELAEIFAHTTARHVMQPLTWQLAPTDTVERAAERLDACGLPFLPVIGDSQLLGLFWRDDAQPPWSRTALEAAREAPPAVSLQTPFAEIHRRFLADEAELLVVLREQAPAGFVLAAELASLDRPSAPLRRSAEADLAP